MKFVECFSTFFGPKGETLSVGGHLMIYATISDDGWQITNSANGFRKFIKREDMTAEGCIEFMKNTYPNLST